MVADHNHNDRAAVAVDIHDMVELVVLQEEAVAD